MKVRTMRKRLALYAGLLALVLSQFLVACGGGATPANPNAPVDLSLWMLPAVPEVAPPPSDWKLYSIVRQKFNINLKVTLLPVGNDAITKLSAAVAGNNLPDLFQISNTSGNLFPEWVKLGVVAPVDSLFPLMPQRTKDRYSDPVLNKLYFINGKQYALTESAGTIAKRGGFFIRKDWLDKLGLAMPKTLDDLLNVATAFTTRDPDGDGKNDTYGFGSIIDSTTYQPGLGNYFAPIYGAYGLPNSWDTSVHGKVSLSVRNPGFLQATEFIRKMVAAKVIDPDWTTLTVNDFRARWKQGKYGIFWEDFCSAICQANYQAFDKNLPNAQLVPMPAPVGPNGQSGVAAYNNVRYATAVSQKAMTAGKGPAIAKLLEWLNSGEGYYLAGFGQQNVNYKLDAQGNISTQGVPTPFTAHAVGPYIQIRNLVLNGNPAELAVRYPSFKTIKGRTIEPLQVLQTITSMPWVDGTATTAAILPAANQADINRYIQEGLVQFITGQKPLTDASWNTYIQGLDTLGVADWETAANKTLQEKNLLP